MKRIEITRFMVGLVCMQVCAEPDATDEEILEVCNRENPSGTSAGWVKVIRKVESWWGPQSQPGPCDEHKERMHFLVAC